METEEKPKSPYFANKALADRMAKKKKRIRVQKKSKKINRKTK
jgi:hypothetical protein